MDKTQKNAFSEVIRCNTESRPMYEGQSRRDYRVMNTVRTTWMLMILDLISPHCEEPVRLVKIFHRLATMDDRRLLTKIDALSDRLVEWLREGHPTKFSDELEIWNLNNEDDDDLALMDLIRVVDELYDSNVIWQVAVHRQILSYPLRVTLQGTQPDFNALLEINASRGKIQPSWLELLSEFSQTILTDDNFSRPFLRAVRFQHGNGSVAFYENGEIKTSTLSPREKDRRLSYMRLASYIGDIPELQDYKSKLLLDSTFVRRNADTDYECPSVVASVPKSWKKQRLIAMEDCTRMYFEQGLFRGFMAAISHNRHLNRHIDLKRAELNVEMAKAGSSGKRQFATLDSSQASDSVSWKLCRAIFGHLSIWPLLEAAGTHAFIVEGREYASKIYATMGNAVCFPVETIIFAIHVMFAYHLLGEQNRRFRVYGDDVICTTNSAELVIKLLTMSGFKLNRDKSFTTRESAFRESCGGEFYNGSSVNPVRISRKFAGVDNRDLRSVVAAMMAYNDMYKYFNSACAYWSDLIRSAGLTYPIYTLDGSLGFKSVDPLSAMADYPRIWNRGYQRLEIKAQHCTGKPRQGRRTSPAALREWLAIAEMRGSEPFVNVRIELDENFRKVSCVVEVMTPIQTSSSPYGETRYKIEDVAYSYTTNSTSRWRKPSAE